METLKTTNFMLPDRRFNLLVQPSNLYFPGPYIGLDAIATRLQIGLFLGI